MKSHLLAVDFSACTIDMPFRKAPVPINAFKAILHFFHIRLSVSGFMLRSVIHLELSFVQEISMKPFTFFYMQMPSLISTIH